MRSDWVIFFLFFFCFGYGEQQRIVKYGSCLSRKGTDSYRTFVFPFFSETFYCFNAGIVQKDFRIGEELFSNGLNLFCQWDINENLSISTQIAQYFHNFSGDLLNTIMKDSEVSRYHTQVFSIFPIGACSKAYCLINRIIVYCISMKENYQHLGLEVSLLVKKRKSDADFRGENVEKHSKTLSAKPILSYFCSLLIIVLCAI